jgi:Zn-dependent protease with chaperone function
MLKAFLKWQLKAIEIAPGILCPRSNFNKIAMCVGPVILLHPNLLLFTSFEEIIAIILHEKAHWHFKHIFKCFFAYWFYSDSAYIKLMWQQELEADLWVAAAGYKQSMINFLSKFPSNDNCSSHPPIKLRIENLVKNG